MSNDVIQLNTTEIINRFDQSRSLDAYFALLKEENEKINLVSRETIASGLPRLAGESLAPFHIIEQKSFETYLDIGSGGGMPSFPICLCLGINNPTLVERTQKKARALERMGERLGFNPHIISRTFEECSLDKKYDLITLRLVKLDDPLLKKIQNILKTGGLFLYYNDCKNFEKKLEKYSLSLQKLRYRIDSNDVTKVISIFKKVG